MLSDHTADALQIRAHVVEHRLVEPLHAVRTTCCGSQTKISTYRFQCPTLDHQRAWLSVLRWIAEEASLAKVPRRLHLPPVMLAPSEAT